MLLNMKRLDEVSPELGDQVAERGACDTAHPVLHHLGGMNVPVRIIGLGERSGGSCSQNGGKIKYMSAAIRAADHRARSRVYGSVDEFMAASELVIAGVLMEERGEDGIAEDLFRCTGCMMRTWTCFATSGRNSFTRLLTGSSA